LSNDQNQDDEELVGQELSDDLAKKYDPERLLKIVSRRAGRGESLDQSLRAKYEKRFGVDLSHVRIVTGEFAEEFNRQKGAYAVTVGATGMILMGGSADRSMATRSGQALLAHELTHVAQARRALSYDKPFAAEGDDHEAEAEAVESEEARGTPAGRVPGPQEIREALDASIEKIKSRVMEMIADVMRNHGHRNGSTRRA